MCSRLLLPRLPLIFRLVSILNCGAGAKNVTQPTMKVKAVTYDTSLGGRDFDYRLAEHLAGVAVTQMAAKGIESSVDQIKANKRAWARLMTAASQAKTVLSANMETYAAVEGLVGSYDLKTTVSRAQFEEMCEDLFARAATPVKEVLAAANTTVEEVGSMEVVGGSVRIPKVQAVLKQTLGLPELSKTLNGVRPSLF
jgi:molecular chaperone DnaK (HSP70)